MARDLGWDEPAGKGNQDSPRRELRPTDRILLYESQIRRINRHQLKHLNSADSGEFFPPTSSDASRLERRFTIFRRAVELDDEEFCLTVYPKTTAQSQFLLTALKNHFIFSEMSPTECEMLVNAMRQDIVKAGTKIIQQGDVGDFFYIVETGTVDFLLEGVHESSTPSKFIGTASPGDSFGELALIYDSPRAVSCVATSTSVTLWKVDHQTFRYLMASQHQSHHSKMKELLGSASIFKKLDDATLSRFVQSLTPVHWEKGSRIVQKGEEGNVFYIIESGSVKVHDIGLGDSNVQDRVLGPGDWFGERALLTGEPRVANVTALSNVVTMAMDRETFEVCLGPSLQHLMEREMRKQSLKAIPIFASGSISEQEIEQLADVMVEVCYRKGEHLSEIDRPYQMNLWIIRHGRVVVYSRKQNMMFNLQIGDYFGDKSLKLDPSHLSSHTATCEENLTVWILRRDQIESVVGDIERLGQPQDFTKAKHVQSMLLGDLKRHRVLGQGAFGRVWLVSYDKLTGFNTTRMAYALKTISKRKVIGVNLVNAVVREKDLLCTISHPLVCPLVASFQDEDYLYLLLPLVPGGDLYDRLRQMSTVGHGMDNNDAAFYAACVIEGIGSGFHNAASRIAYRDLKLENVMIDEAGYGIIVDLGFAKVVTGTTYTLCGTPEMLAPELLMSKGHDHSVDYWAFGVVVYELLVGRSPFYIPGATQIEMFKRIVLVKYDIPSYVKESARTLITALLIRKPSSRLGNLANGHLDIKTHQWFKESVVSFKEIFRKEVVAPWIPVTKDPFDASQGDSRAHLKNEPYGNKLTKEEQEMFKDF